ncbi:MAG: hypothetical protein IPO21_10195 [Bacteroidales bacterium]|nr:hypothetical protein [Bacteroidales bacterium]
MDSSNNSVNQKKISFPLIIWTSIIAIGVVVKLLHFLSPILIVIGFAGLTSYTINEFIVLKKISKLKISLTIICSLFLVVLLGGSFFNNGFPLNIIAVIIYFVSLIIFMIINITRNRKNANQLNN